MVKKIKHNWKIPAGCEPTEFDKKILRFQERGEIVPTRNLIKTPEQIEGIRASGLINTGVLDFVESKIKAGISTAEIDKMVYDYTTQHGAIPAPLHYEGFPKSVCTSINEVVCHGIPSTEEILEEGDIINVDVSTIYNGYFSDASRMFIIGNPNWRSSRTRMGIHWGHRESYSQTCTQKRVQRCPRLMWTWRRTSIP